MSKLAIVGIILGSVAGLSFFFYVLYRLGIVEVILAILEGLLDFFTDIGD